MREMVRERQRGETWSEGFWQVKSETTRVTYVSVKLLQMCL